MITALYGVGLAALVTVITSGSWEAWPQIVGTSIAVQVLAQLTGTGFGLIVPWAWIASLLTIVEPLGAFQALAGSGLQA